MGEAGEEGSDDLWAWDVIMRPGTCFKVDVKFAHIGEYRKATETCTVNGNYMVCELHLNNALY